MIGVSNINATQQAKMPVGAEQAKLSSDEMTEGEMMAAVIRAIPRQNRQEVLAALQALICTPATHTVNASFVA
jgi:hypothetical protein